MTMTARVLDLAPPETAADHAVVLVVEDDDAVGVQLVRGLVRAGYTATRVATGTAALAAVEGPTPPDLVLLDLGLPDLDGTEVCRRIRAHGDTPVIVVTARGDEPDRVEVLDLGGDDYLVKPFGFAELLARIRAVRRRFARAEALVDAARAATSGATPVLADDEAPAPRDIEPDVAGAAGGGLDPDVIRHGTLVVDRRTRRITLAGRPVAATAREFDLLAYLAADPGRVRTRREIFQEIWGPWFGSTKVLDVHIGSLRRKLGRPELIETVYGVGFRLADPAEPAG
ncbi:two component transcriptional regulator, winged helix family [Pseudofrankia inefficax]|uniref:Two component transcriptional regulator, winged helix family n=2 Tax=Pseudofrankia inefficax (strain DSM 45817 / CECT 9037 / DDB 130130 / EuI1c) TaxID=298654 RepID=E3J335_PSEI1|nr:two component transcriptional regulator, winged helix family [Pseudofrankia inefficax]